MSDGYGTPITLHFDGADPTIQTGLAPMELMAQSFVLSVDRKVGGMGLPLSGGLRFSVDLNTPRPLIVIEGVFTDDTADRRLIAARKSTALIDTAVDASKFPAFGAASDISSADYEKLVGATIQLTDIGGTVSTITFSSGSATLNGSTNVSTPTANTATIVVGQSTTWITGSVLATSIATAIANMSGCAMTTTIGTSTLVPTAGSTSITISAGTTGKHTEGMNFTTSGGERLELYRVPFFGGHTGSEGKAKSAGDKVQDLWGILNNTARNSMKYSAIGTSLGIIGAMISNIAGAAAALMPGGMDGADAMGSSGIFATQADYPIGIQIPYNSMFQADNGEMYSARNFIIANGYGHSTSDKLSDGNELAAGGVFSEDDERSGIKGAVSKIDISYSAGENVYTYQLVFAPIDFILA